MTTNDPTRDQMVAALQAPAAAISADQMDIERAIYWFASDWHAGLSSNLYKVLSTSTYRPGPSEIAPVLDDDQDFAAGYLYDELEAIFIIGADPANG